MQISVISLNVLFSRFLFPSCSHAGRVLLIHVNLFCSLFESSPIFDMSSCLSILWGSSFFFMNINVYSCSSNVSFSCPFPLALLPVRESTFLNACQSFFLFQRPSFYSVLFCVLVEFPFRVSINLPVSLLLLINAYQIILLLKRPSPCHYILIQFPYTASTYRGLYMFLHLILSFCFVYFVWVDFSQYVSTYLLARFLKRFISLFRPLTPGSGRYLVTVATRVTPEQSAQGVPRAMNQATISYQHFAPRDKLWEW